MAGAFRNDLYSLYRRLSIRAACKWLLANKVILAWIMNHEKLPGRV